MPGDCEGAEVVFLDWCAHGGVEKGTEDCAQGVGWTSGERAGVGDMVARGGDGVECCGIFWDGRGVTMSARDVVDVGFLMGNGG